MELDKKLETYKSELTLEQLKKERLDSRRSEILEELYKRIVDLDFAMQELTAVFKQVKLDIIKKSKNELANRETLIMSS